MKKKQINYLKGKICEFYGKVFLILKGYKILNSRSKTYVGEIDIIASKNNCIIFIEVKHRATFKLAIESIQHRQCQRIINAAKIWLSKNTKYKNYDIRFDAILCNKFFLIQHIKNAWQITMGF